MTTTSRIYKDGPTLGYVRLSQLDDRSVSVEGQIADLKAVGCPTEHIFIDAGVSGEFNLQKPDHGWSNLMSLFYRLVGEGEKPRICMVADDRLGRKHGKVMSIMEDITDAGGSLYFIHDDDLHTDSEDFGQALKATMKSLNNQQYRVDIKRKTKRSLATLKDAGVRLGSKPKLSASDVADVQALAEKGLGYTAIGKVMGVSRTTVKNALSGEYVTREEWEKRNAAARRTLLR